MRNEGEDGKEQKYGNKGAKGQMYSKKVADVRYQWSRCTISTEQMYIKKGADVWQKKGADVW